MNIRKAPRRLFLMSSMSDMMKDNANMRMVNSGILSSSKSSALCEV